MEDQTLNSIPPILKLILDEFAEELKTDEEINSDSVDKLCGLLRGGKVPKPEEIKNIFSQTD